MRGFNKTLKCEFAAAAVILLAACSSGGSSGKATTTTVAAGTTTTVLGTPQRLTFTGGVNGTMTTAHKGPQASDTICAKGIWNVVGAVGTSDYKLQMQTPADGPTNVQLSQAVGPGETPPVIFLGVADKVMLTVAKDERSGSIDADLKPLQGAEVNVHVTGQWACLRDG